MRARSARSRLAPSPTRLRELPAPAEPKLKSAAQFRFIGKEGAVRKLDVPDKTNGKALFTIDAVEPDTLVAVVAHPPVFGATPRSFDDAKARAERGVIDVRALSTGVAVYAKDTWSAIKGREALTVVWDESKAETDGSDQIFARLSEAASRPGVVATKHGDVDSVLKSGANSWRRNTTSPTSRTRRWSRGTA